MKLQLVIDTALAQPCTLSSFTEKLKQAHVAVRMNTAKTGFISGISFSIDGVAFKGSSLGHQYTWSNLKKRGLYMSKIDTLRNMSAEASQAVLQEVDDTTLLQARIAILNKQEELS
ncbi:MAG: hypothetical protein V8Q91_10510 [Bilophila wadsworthia]|uniref:hypothetical protein n=1 Tax=Bilophila wadsworthia TaxID=35833 RepID=UPI00300F2400